MKKSDKLILFLILKNDLSNKKMDLLVNDLIEKLPEDAVIISSIDFSHYQTLPVANFHDELSVGVIKSFDYDRLEKLEIDSIPSLYVLLKLMDYYETQKVVHEKNDNAALIVNSLKTKETTSYYSPYFVKGDKENENVASILHFGNVSLDKHKKDYSLEGLSGEENRFFSGMDIVMSNVDGYDGLLNIRGFGDIKIAFIKSEDYITDLDQINKLINKSRQAGVKYIIATIKSGDEHELIDMGVDVVIVNNSNFDERMKIYNNSPIFYYLENISIGLVFDHNDNLSISIFPLELGQDSLSLMEYNKSVNFINKIIDDSQLGEYNFNNFNLKINFNN